MSKNSSIHASRISSGCARLRSPAAPATLLPLLAEQAAKLDCAFIATGHYARIEVDEGGVSHIITAVDAEADQSALLADLPQELLAKLVLPLGEFSKADAAEIAAAKAE